MEGPISDWLTTGIDTLVVSVLIVGFVSVLMLGSQASEVIVNQNDLMAELAEYREYNQYDGTIVYPQDVISAIYRYRGDPFVTVSSANGKYMWATGSGSTEVTGEGAYVWVNNPAQPLCGWNTSAISALIDQTVMYDAAVMRGVAGDIIGYEFRAR